jgi:hypothetical protein
MPMLGSLTPYPPDPQSDRAGFAEVKRWMRIVKERTVDETWRHIGRLVATFEPNECSNYFEYASIRV